MPGRSRNADVVGSVRQAIGALLANGRPAINRVAPFIGLNPRTLQRRLAEAGTTYSQIVDEVRTGTAQRLVDDSGLTLAEISSILGYSDPAHFTRAFTRWTGMTPRAYRLRHRQNRTDRGSIPPPPQNRIRGQGQNQPRQTDPSLRA